MTQNNLYMEDEGLNLYVDVQPLFLDTLESSKNSAVQSAAQAAQSASDAQSSLESVSAYKTNIELLYAESVNNLNLLSENLMSNITEARDSAIEDIEDKSEEVIQEIEESGIDKDQLIQSGALETGNVSKDKDAYAWIQSMAHSAYSGTKFTAQGTPSVTDIGIAGGFSSGNYLTASIGVTPKKCVKLTYKIKIKSLPAETERVWSSSTDADFYGTLKADGSLNICFGNGITTEAGIGFEEGQFVTGGWIYLNCVFTKDSYTLQTTTENGCKTTKTGELSISSFNQISSLILGKDGANDTSYLSDALLDLKYFAVTVDDFPVFSGNKTGIDTVKANNYCVEGNPSITSDGYASGFEQDNYVYANSVTFSDDTVNKICVRVIFKKGGTSQSQVVWGDVNGSGMRSEINFSRTKITFRNTNNKTKTFDAFDEPLEDGDILDMTYILNGTAITCKIVKNLSEVIMNQTIPDGVTAYSNVLLRVGVQTSSINAMVSSIDLSSLRIYKDDVLAYQACLKIPYTESKTGSKIVDAVYRERVKDYYEQYGYAPYYTLNEDLTADKSDITLPMGEIYGMIEKIRNLINEPGN